MGLLTTGIHNVGLFRKVATVCEIEKEYIWNKKFDILNGREYITPLGEIDFGEESIVFNRKVYNRREVNKISCGANYYYTTGYGYMFNTNSLIYDHTSDVNINYMVRRHWALKIPEKVEKEHLEKYGIVVDKLNFDKNLTTNQRSWYANYTEEFKKSMELNLGRYYHHSSSIGEDSLHLLEDTTHAKFALRLAGWTKLMDGGDNGKLVYKSVLEWKMKKYENAKPGKYPRVIVDATVENSLPRVDYANGYKMHCADKPIEFTKKVAVFFCSSPRYSKVGQAFHMILTHNYKIFIVHYSDDAILSILINGVYTYYNVDIASNDSSHTECSFVAYAHCANMSPEQAANLLGVVMAPFKITNYDGTKKILMKPKSGYGYLPSGIGDTTTKNNFVYQCIAFELNRLLELGYIECLELVTLAAYNIGFRLTYQECSCPAEMQFLKMSFFYLGSTDMRICVMDNPAKLLNYSGFAKFGKIELPKKLRKLDIDTRFKWYQTLLTFGFFKKFYYKPWLVLCPYYDVLIKDTKLLTESEIAFFTPVNMLHVLDSDQPNVVLTRREFYSHYIDITDEEIDEFEALLHHHELYKVLSHIVVDKMLLRDYGLNAWKR